MRVVADDWNVVLAEGSGDRCEGNSEGRGEQLHESKPSEFGERQIKRNSRTAPTRARWEPRRSGRSERRMVDELRGVCDAVSRVR